jgi:energy-coupling factor transporter ATP-binding protein EcfA2
VPPIVSIRGLTVHAPGEGRDRPAWLRDVSFDLSPGERVAIVGRTGAGRSTLLQCINGIIPSLVRAPRTGSVVVDGRDSAVVGAPDMARVVATVLDDPEAQVTQLTVLDEVAFALENLGLAVGEIDRLALDALARVGLAGFEDRSPLTLSGGEQQRLAIASAIAMRPRVLLLDEPTANLDPASAGRVVRLLDELVGARPPAAVLVASSDADLFAPWVDRVLWLQEGRVAGDGSPRRIFTTISRAADHPAVPQVTELAGTLDGAGPELPVTVEAFPGWLAAGSGAERPSARSAVPARRESGAPWRAAAVPDPGQALVSFDGASYRYPGAAGDAVSGISLSAAAGEIVAVIGASGSGKSTLARLVTGLLRPDPGRVVVAGADTRRVRTQVIARDAGLVYQDPGHQLFESTVADELALGPRNTGVAAAETADRARAVVDALGLGEVLGQHPAQLALGVRKRVAIGAVLTMRPRILVLDEPTTGQDRAETAWVDELIRTEAARGTLVILVSHDLRFVAGLATRVVALVAGRVRLDGPTRTVLGDTGGLADAGLEPPPVVRLALQLGLGTPAGVPLTVLEVATCLLERDAHGAG